MLPTAPDLGLLFVRTGYSDDRAWRAALSAATAVYRRDDFANLSLANMDLAEFADNIDADGIFRGF